MRLLFTAVFLLFFSALFAQNIFSEGEIEYKKLFAPYEVQNVVSLAPKEFIVLMEEKKGSFQLSRYDEYFFDKWSVNIDYGKEGSFPKLFKIDNEIIIFRYWTYKGKAYVEIKKYNIETGEQTHQEQKIIWEAEDEIEKLELSFSASNAHFLVYHPNAQNSKIDVYSTSTLEQVTNLAIPISLTDKKTKTFLDDQGDVFLAIGDIATYSLDIYFFSDKNTSPIKLTSNLAFQRPPDDFSAIDIVKQSESTFLVHTVANIEDEIVGINFSSFNVVLKSLLFSNNFNTDSEFIKTAYQESVFTSENQKKKYVTTPESLSGFHFQEMFIDKSGNITTILEHQELPSTYHNVSSGLNFGLKWKEPDEINYRSEDILLVNINSEGEINWKKVIQKYQLSQGNGLTLSYLSSVTNENELNLVMKESAKGNSMYYFNLDLVNGNVISKQSFMDQKMNINKNYCAWLSDKTLLLCGYKPGSNKRKFYMVEL